MKTGMHFETHSVAKETVAEYSQALQKAVDNKNISDHLKEILIEALRTGAAMQSYTTVSNCSVVGDKT